VFAINLFNSEDRDYLTRFTKARAKQPDKMAGVKFERGAETGCPILEGAAAFMEGKVVQMVNVGDYDVLIGEIINAGILKPGKVEDTLTLPDLGWSYAG
jgi:flavin reductase (DIM6/NTAB) family NADH-FMN oxidoreductase RutF